jgi:hypothetical protein
VGGRLTGKLGLNLGSDVNRDRHSEALKPCLTLPLRSSGVNWSTQNQEMV